SVAAVFFLIMYLIPFWDLIPTLVMHKYYCSTQAGFWVYKTPEEWVSENPDAAKTIINYEKSKIERPANGKIRFFINERLVEEVDRSVEAFHAITREEMAFFDSKDNSVLIKKINFIFGRGSSSINSGGDLEGWRRFFVFLL